MKMTRWCVGALAVLPWACLTSETTPPPTNDLLIVGYDREPDTLNRFATHILEDTMICIVEGLTVWNEKMEVVPVLAEVVPSYENGGWAAPSCMALSISPIDPRPSCRQRMPSTR